MKVFEMILRGAARLYPEVWFVALMLAVLVLSMPLVLQTSASASESSRLRTEGFARHVMRPVGTGVVHHQLSRITARGPIFINVVEVDLAQPGVSIQPVMASSMHLHGKSNVRKLALQRGAVAAVNGSFFKPDTGTAIGMVIINQEFMSGPLYNRVCLGITKNNQVRMDRLTFNGKATTVRGGELVIRNVNQPRLNKAEWILYSHRWGAKSPNTPKEGIQIQVKQGQIMAISREPLAIPKEGFVLVGPESDIQAHPVHLAEPLAVQIYTKPDWSDVNYAISGGPYLIKDNQIYVDASAQHFLSKGFLQPAPRTAVGVTADNRLIMVTVDGRQKNVSVGLTLYELAKMMQQLGAVQAMNFDGGSSTQMVVRGQVVNAPTAKGGAAVSNALLVFADGLPANIDKALLGSSNTAPIPAVK